MTMQTARRTTRAAASRMGARQLRRALGASLALAAGLGIAGAGAAAPASAAGPNVLYSAGQNVNFPTWFWGTTTVCATNLSYYSWGTATVRGMLSPYPTTLMLSPNSTRCTTQGWGGVPVNVANSGPSPLRVYSY